MECIIFFVKKGISNLRNTPQRRLQGSGFKNQERERQTHIHTHTRQRERAFQRASEIKREREKEFKGSEKK